MKNLNEQQIERIEKALSNYKGSNGAVGRFWELYEEGAELAGVSVDKYVSIDEYIEYLEQ